METESKKGYLHPITQTIRQAVSIWNDLGFEVAEGPEIETEHYNFDALNIPANHPARDLWDTFWLKPLSARKLLRTHTSPVQIRYMEKHKKDLPIRIIVPGKTFRHEATDATHEAQFFQMEGLAVGEGITLANMKSVLITFFKKLYGPDADVRFRPSFFPFTEPSVEIDVSCFKCAGKDSACPLCKGTGWIEVMGGGMVNPKVLEGVGIDHKKYTGFAFGFGLDRLVMLKYGVDDIRSLYSGDLRLWQVKK
ncbi:MAG: phenylalanine--tRNA ligase subunit alpha [Candidatus Pacebacteria bacterium]|nr:phenylalanine--tRNA ligase subunit alpha [Candidatus Paceibacterota bacterium]MDD5356611.1 phenylalanine--tRNA ligase subunit alpha [Candidatus Paceibacterota bacterium]